MSRPIRPDEVGTAKADLFPDAVWEAFNELLVREFVDGRATIKQKDVVFLMESKGLNRVEIYKKGWLNVEKAYEDSGWVVEYDKPGYNEDYPPTFTFRSKRKR